MNEQFGVIDSVETAFGHLEAFISGGDELGEVPEKDAIDAVNYLRARIAELELRLDVGTGNMYDVVVMENEKLRAQLTEAQAKAELYEGAIREFGAVDETGVNDAPINFELWARHQDAATAIIDLARNLPPKEG